jgi:hypothetical protein
MGAGGYTYQGNEEDIIGSYGTMSKGIDLSTLFFRSRTEVTDYNTIDYDGIGINFEHSEHYYVIAKPHREEARNSGWLNKRLVGTHLISEWEFLPKLQIGKLCIASNGRVGGWWTFHSKTIMHLRKEVSFMALRLQRIRLDSKTVVSEEKFHAALTSEFGKFVASTFNQMRAKKGI